MEMLQDITESLLNQMHIPFRKRQVGWLLVSHRYLSSYRMQGILKLCNHGSDWLWQELFRKYLRSNLRWYCLAICTSQATIKLYRLLQLFICLEVETSIWFQYVKCFTYQLPSYSWSWFLNWILFRKEVNRETLYWF